MNVDMCNGFLQAIALLNYGPDHGTTYMIEALSSGGSLESSLGIYFSQASTSHCPQRPAEDWHIRTAKFDDEWIEALRQIAHHWFFNQQFSPKVDNSIAKNVVEHFLAHIGGMLDRPVMFQVDVSPPMFYECAWQDVAFDTGEGRWLLHFGISD